MTTEILIYDDIGPDWAGMVSAKSIVDLIDKVGRGLPVTVRINSPGGDVTEAQAIYNAMRRQSKTGGKVTVEIDGLAASAASYVAMAGDRINIAENAMMMIHKAWTFAFGNADEIRSTADILDKFDGIISATYAARSGMSVDDVMAKMLDETWLTADEAIESGLADGIGEPLNVAASIRPGRYAKTPAKFLAAEKPLMNAGHQNMLAKQRIRIAQARI